MFDIVFEKAKGRGRTVNRTSVYAEAAPQGFFKKGRKIYKKTFLPKSLFLIKLNFVYL